MSFLHCAAFFHVSKNFKGKRGKPHQINENIEIVLMEDPFESSEASGTVSLMKPSPVLAQNGQILTCELPLLSVHCALEVCLFDLRGQIGQRILNAYLGKEAVSPRGEWVLKMLGYNKISPFLLILSEPHKSQIYGMHILNKKRTLQILIQAQKMFSSYLQPFIKKCIFSLTSFSGHKATNCNYLHTKKYQLRTGLSSFLQWLFLRFVEGDGSWLVTGHTWRYSFFIYVLFHMKDTS